MLTGPVGELGQQVDPLGAIGDRGIAGLIHQAGTEAGVALVGFHIEVVEDVDLHRLDRTE